VSEQQPTVHQHINDLVAEEHSLRERLAKGEISADEEHARLKAIETELDQLWDLLRQRQARSEFGQDPSGAAARNESTVEGYLQ
jgi:predicted nuclease with TOPRIM domain